MTSRKLVEEVRAATTRADLRGTFGLLALNAILGLGAAAHFVWTLARLDQNEPLPFRLMFLGYATVFLFAWVVAGRALGRRSIDPAVPIKLGVAVLVVGSLIGLVGTAAFIAWGTVQPDSVGAGGVFIGLLLTVLCAGAALGSGLVTSAAARSTNKNPGGAGSQ